MNKISKSESTGSVKDVGNVNPGHLSVIGTLPINFSLTTLDLSLQPKLPEDIKVNGNDLENVIEAELVPAVINAKKKDPNLTEVQSTAKDSSNKIIEKLTECNTDLEELKCPYCDNRFDNIKLILHWHIYESHKDRKKEYF